MIENAGCEPFATFLGRTEAAAALEQAEWIRANIPVLQRANGSGKFFSNYVTYGFWRDSRLPLIREFVSQIEAGAGKFEKAYGRRPSVDYIYLSYIEDASQESCIWHRDGYWWDGQFHLTIKGNARIQIQDEGIEALLTVEDGAVWYLNGTRYRHRIQESIKGPRFELLAPCAFREESARRHFEAVTDTAERWIDPAHPSFQAELNAATAYMKNSLAQGKASNPNVASWAVAGNVP